jgi:putative membrane protein
MRTTLITVMVIFLGISHVSCNDSNNSTTGTATETIITDSIHATNKDTVMQPVLDVSTFITETAKGGMMEVELGKIAQQNGESQDVKEYGAMMVKDHSAANAELMDIAKSKNIILPNDSSEQHANELKIKKGAEFDKAYVAMMVLDHEKDVAAFENASKSADASVSAFATKTLPVLKKHLETIKVIQAKMQK